MKKIISFALLVLVFWATGVCTAEVPDLLGNWTGLGDGRSAEEDGSFQPYENWSLNATIGEQKGRLFSGYMTYMGENGTEVVESFAGAIGLDNKALYIAEYDGGYDIGSMISDDEIELIYLKSGRTGEIEIDRLYRIKP